jgi:hypothetical protein
LHNGNKNTPESTRHKKLTLGLWRKRKPLGSQEGPLKKQEIEQGSNPIPKILQVKNLELVADGQPNRLPIHG